MTGISPKAENNLRIGGKFNYRMEAKDRNFGFDFGGGMMPLKSIKIWNTLLVIE